MQLKSIVKKGLAVAAVAAVSVMGAVTLAQANSNNGVITIHKYTKTDTNGITPGTGATTDARNLSGGEVVEGVEFTIKKIKQTGDLSTNAQLKIAAEIQELFKTQKNVTEIEINKSPSGKEKVAFDNPSGTKQKTNASGEAKFESLSRGLYYVYESDVSGAKVGSQKKQVTPAEPFFVALPLDGKMTVDVYPKNQVSEDTTKVPDFSDLKSNKVTYTVTAFLPKKPAAGFKKFDLLDKPGTAFNKSSFKLTGLKAVKKGEETSPKKEWSLNGGVAIDGSHSSISVTKNGSDVINCSFTSTGLTELGTAADQGANQVIYTYTLDLDSNFVNTGGVVENKALVVPSPESATDIDGGSGDGGTPPGVVVDTKKLVNLKIKKQDGQTTNPLQGAQFDVYSCSAAGKAGDDVTTNYQNIKGEAKNRTEAQKWNTEALVSQQTTGLTNGVLIPESTKVCIKETLVPDSADTTPYMELPEDVLVTTNTVDSSSSNTQQTVTVDNYKRNFQFALPMTGANAMVVLSLAGLALISAAVILRVRRAKQ